jgi:hypothetical protein
MTDYTTTGFSAVFPDVNLQELGEQVTEYRSAPKRNIGRNLGMLLMIAGFALFTYAAFMPSLRQADQVGFRTGGIVIAIVGYLAIEVSLRYRQTQVLIFQKGLARVRDGKVETVRWESIQGMWQNVTKHYTNGVYTGTTHVYTLQTNDGKKYVFNDSIKQAEQLGTQLQNVITSIRLPEAYSAFQSGQTVNFGPLSISQSGVSKGNQTVPWNEIQGVEVVKGHVKFKKQGAWFNFANVGVSQIPNLFVFLSLVDRITGINMKGK